MGPKTAVCLTVVCLFHLAHNVIAQSSENVPVKPIQKQQPDNEELFIDDDINNHKSNDKFETDDDVMLGEEGSGVNPSIKGTGAEDMESSGSGYGPDDEDAQINGRTKNKSTIDTDEDDEETNDDDEEDEDIDVNEDIKKGKPTSSTTSSTSTTTSTVRTPETDDVETRILNVPNQNPNVDDVNVPISDTTSTSSTTISPPPSSNAIDEHSSSNGVYISPNSHPERTSSFFAQPGILAAVIGGAVVGLLCAILVVMFIVYRMRKKDEGSYPLEETKRSPATNPYLKSTHREFYA